jgi:Lrp/AsnC family transcriptional regulator for asnA, asnC and gidA
MYIERLNTSTHHLKTISEKMPRKTNIDEVDAIILRSLLNESRTSFTEIAKKCGISVVAVRQRYKNLWKAGIINGEIMLINPFSLGYRYISLIGIITTKENESEAAKFLKSRPYIPIVFGSFGKYNLVTEIALCNIEELSKIQRGLENNPLIKRSEVLIWSDTIITEHPENLIIKPFSGKIEHTPITVKQKEAQMDEIDRKIAKILSQKARTPFRKIAEHLGISTKNVIERYKKLRGNVLTLSTITVDLNKLGYTAGAFLFIKLSNKSKIPEVEAELLKIPNLIVFVKYIGVYDVFAHVVFEDFQEYFKMAEGINRIQNIDRVDIFLVPSGPAWPPNIFASLLE